LLLIKLRKQLQTNPDGTYHHQVQSIIDEVETANKKGSPFIYKGQALILDPDLSKLNSQCVVIELYHTCQTVH
jgi:hypothetical protein